MAKPTHKKKAPLRIVNTKPNRADRRKVNRKAGIDEKKMNAGGFYEGMPGVFLDADGNRKMYEVLITPQGEVITKLGCHPVHLKQCLSAVVTAQPIFRSVIMTVAHQYAADKAKAQAEADAKSVEKLNMKPKKGKTTVTQGGRNMGKTAAIKKAAKTGK